MSVFLLGAFVTSASGVRLYYHLQIVESGPGSFDFTCKLLPIPVPPSSACNERTVDF